MRVGLLSQFLDIYRMVDRQSDSGAMTKEKMLLCTLRCSLQKQKGFFSRESSVEEMDVVRLTFETWLNETVRDTDTAIWCNQEFKIYLIEYDYPKRTMKLYLQKINK